MLRRCSIAFTMLTLLIAGACGNLFVRTSEETRTNAGASPAVQYMETVLASADHIEENLQAIAQAADRAADRLMAGGHLYAAGDERGFAEEAHYRAGGMMMVEYAPTDPAEAERSPEYGPPRPA